MGVGRADKGLKATAAPKSGGEVLGGDVVDPNGVAQRGVMLGGFKETSDGAFIVGPRAGREGVMNALRQGEILLPVIHFAGNFHRNDRLAIIARAANGVEMKCRTK